MKKVTLFLLILRILVSENLFDLYNVHSLDIEFHNPNYDQILKSRWEIDDKTYELATIIFNGDTLDSVGVRYKGNSTFYFTNIFDSPKFPLNIDLDLVYSDQDLLGYNKVKLSNAIFDPTFVKENIGYLTQSYYLPTPETGYMSVKINGQELGLYTSVESINKSFLSKHFGNSNGSFFKCEPQFLFGQEYDAWPNLAWHGEDSLAYDYQMGYELKSENGWSDLLELIYTLNYDTENINNILNVDRALWYLASSTVTPDLDAYTGMYVHNYYLYKNTETNLFEIIPWDKDQTFGNTMVNTLIQWGGNASWVYEWNPFLYQYDDERPLFSKLMEIPLYNKIYAAHIRTILDSIYFPDHIQSIAYGIQDSIEQVSNEFENIWPSLNFGDYFQYNVDNYLITQEGTNFCGIIPTIENRRDYLLNHSEILKDAPRIEYVFQEIREPLPNETVIIQAEVLNAETVELMVTTDQFSGQFFSIPMYDDGNHNDMNPGDNVYGGSIPFQEQGRQIRYYIRAINSDALVLEPRTAEKDFFYYSIGLGNLPDSTVTINEINYNSANDHDSGDWVELYNPTNDVIPIGGWQFKDEDDSHIFIIPENTILNANQYLVLINDSSKYFQHYNNSNVIGELNFGLSGGGELLRLFNIEGSLLDTVHYDDEDPWPTEADGNGSTLELTNPNSDNANYSNWMDSDGYGTPGSQNSVYLSSSEKLNLPTEFFLFNNYPNPFNPSTTISYNIPIENHVRIKIYNILGKEVKTLVDQKMKPGKNVVKWNGKNNEGIKVAGGVYLYSIQVENYKQTRKMIMLK